MLDLPKEPGSVCVSADGNDVFLSFHWELISPRHAANLANELGIWVEEKAADEGYSLTVVELGE